MSDLETQAQIMQNANRIREELKNLYAWEKDIKETDAKRNTVPDDKAYDYNYPVRNEVSSNPTSSTSCQNEQESSGDSYMHIPIKKLTEAEKRANSPFSHFYPLPSRADSLPAYIERANDFKIRGNDHVKAGSYQKAIHYYTEAIRLHDSDPVYYTNRALCYLKQNKFTECVQDCTKAIELDDRAIKAYYRRAQAYEQMQGDLEVAVNDCRTILEIEPKNVEARRSLDRIEGILNSKESKATQQDLKVESMAKQITWSQYEGKDDFESVDFVMKPPHQRSTKTLKTVVIDETSTSVASVIDSTSKSNIDQTSQKSQPSVKTKKQKKPNKMPVIEKIPDVIPVRVYIPRNTAEFYKVWPSIRNDKDKFAVLKGIYNADISKMLGAQFNLEILRDIFGILKSHFVEENLPIIKILNGIVKNEQMTIISAMMNAEDKLAFNKLMDFVRNRGEPARTIDAIQKHFDELVSM